MADLSAVTSVTISGKSVFGNKRVTWGSIVLGDSTSTMPAAGLAVTATQLGLGNVDWIMFSNKTLPYSWLSDKLCSGAGAAVPISGDIVYFNAFGIRQNK